MRSLLLVAFLCACGGNVGVDDAACAPPTDDASVTVDSGADAQPDVDVILDAAKNEPDACIPSQMACCLVDGSFDFCPDGGDQ